MTGEYGGNLFTVQVVSSFASTRLLLLKRLLLLLVSFVSPCVCLSIHLSMYLSIYLTTYLSISISRSISSPYLYLYLCYSALMPIPEYICDSPTQSYSSNCHTRTCQECSASRAATAFVANTSASLCSRYSDSARRPLPILALTLGQPISSSVGKVQPSNGRERAASKNTHQTPKRYDLLKGSLVILSRPDVRALGFGLSQLAPVRG